MGIEGRPQNATNKKNRTQDVYQPLFLVVIDRYLHTIKINYNTLSIKELI